MRRARYLLTLKGRPPFRLAGIEMFDGFTELLNAIEILVDHIPDKRLVSLKTGIVLALTSVGETYDELIQVAFWLRKISDILNPDINPSRTSNEVCEDLFEYLDQIVSESHENETLSNFVCGIYKTTSNYESGLFHTYDIVALPRTNNDRESEFRDLYRRLLMTTGQKGAARRILQRAGAWEAIPRHDSYQKTMEAISQVDQDDFVKERARVVQHRGRFNLHTRSQNHVTKILAKLQDEWLKLPKMDA